MAAERTLGSIVSLRTMKRYARRRISFARSRGERGERREGRGDGPATALRALKSLRAR
jgi:hypothetical protein